MSNFEKIFTDNNYKKDYFKNRKGHRNLISYKQDFNFVLDSLKRGSTVVDYGCGEMIFSNYLEKEFKTFVFDLSPFISKKKEYLAKNQFSFDSKYDAIILRGVLQHLPDPFLTLQKISKNINDGGKLIFLATPNTSSPYYFINSDLPPLDPKINFWVPSFIELNKTMMNLGFKLHNLQYPYLGSGYESVIKDHFYFFLNLFGKKRKYAFWRSMMNVSFIKCTNT